MKPPEIQKTILPSARFDGMGTKEQIDKLSQLLQGLQGRDPNDGRQREDFARLTSWLRGSADRAGSNAAGSYAARQMAAGLDASAADLVGAQVRFPAYGKVAEAKMSFDQQQANEQRDRNRLAADVSKSLASLRLDYARTVADFNSREADRASNDSRWEREFALDKPVKEGNATLQNLQIEAAIRAGERDKKMTDKARASDASASDFNPGYITNSGPLKYATGGGAAPNTVYAAYPERFNPLTGLTI